MTTAARSAHPCSARLLGRLFFAALCLAAATTVPARAAEPSPAAMLVARLALPTPAVRPFMEVRYSAVLTRPMVSSGDLEYRGPTLLYKRILVPYREQQSIEGDQVTVEREGEQPRRFSLRRNPELKGVLNSLGSLMAGDHGALARTFSITLEEDDHGWTLQLVPRSERAGHRLRDILVTGDADKPRCVVTREPDGDASFMLLGEASQMEISEPPARDRIEDHCRAPRG